MTLQRLGQRVSRACSVAFASNPAIDREANQSSDARIGCRIGSVGSIPALGVLGKATSQLIGHCTCPPSLRQLLGPLTWSHDFVRRRVGHLLLSVLGPGRASDPCTLRTEEGANRRGSLAQRRARSRAPLPSSSPRAARPLTPVDLGYSEPQHVPTRTSSPLHYPLSVAVFSFFEHLDLDRPAFTCLLPALLPARPSAPFRM